MGLYDAILIKENHVALAGGLGGGGARRPARPGPSCRSRSSAATSSEVEEALDAGARPAAARQHGPRASCGAAVELRDGSGVGLRSSRPPAASTLENVRAIAETGVDFISVGALTHSAPALDLSMYVEPA